MKGRIFRVDKSGDTDKAFIIGTWSLSNEKRCFGTLFCGVNAVKNTSSANLAADIGV